MDHLIWSENISEMCLEVLLEVSDCQGVDYDN